MKCQGMALSFAVDGGKQTVNGEAQCGADDVFMMPCAGGAWSWKSKDKNQEKWVTARFPARKDTG